MKKLLLTVLISTSALVGYSQKIKLIDGDLSALKGQKTINTEFSYDNMAVGKYPKEQEYVTKKKADYNEKEPGRGDSWAVKWVEDRQTRYEPQFKKLLTHHLEMTADDASAPYTLIFKTTKTEVGYNIGISRMPAFIDGEAWLVESKNKDKVIAKLSVLKSPGRDAMGFDYDTGSRIEEAYAKAGKEIAQFITKKLKK